MKKTIFTLALSLILGTASFANNDESINQKAVQSFKKEFAQAKEVSWQKAGDLVKATFTLNERVLFAYYNEAGDLMAITRNITTDLLPIALQTSLRKDYAGYWVSDLFEMVTGGQTNYYVTLENADHKIVMKSEDFGNWASYRKERK
ncbi:MAG TPA: hypothetical protein VEV87_07770 [Chitinophagaceae bacterium]|nr:hypothetical protein [Chitinophagaceae bacterium]